MTLAEAVKDIQGKVAVDLDVGFDISNPTLVTVELMKAARTVSRDTYFLMTLHSPLTLTACVDGASDGAEIDLLSVTASTKQIFHCYGIHINGGWLDAIQFDKFINQYQNYVADTADANPRLYVPMSPSSVRLWPVPNATAVAASDNYAIGFYLHDQYTWAANQDTELLGPQEFHDLVVDRCFLDITGGYVAGEDALRRRSIIQKNYEDKSTEYKANNQARTRKIQRNASAGMTVRTFPVYGGGPR